MRMSTGVRRTLATLSAGALVVIGALSGTAAANAAQVPVPPVSSITKMAALGDSITQALMTCSSLSGCPVNSWSTGTTASVNSHLLRLKAAGAASITGVNDSVTGTLSAGLNAQAQTAVTQGAQYVTIEIGANDACTKTVAQMTTVDAYTKNVQAALTTLASSAKPPQVFVASVPSLQQLYNVNKSNFSARFAWAIFGICQSMLANPGSTATADVQRRTSVQQRVDAYNTVLSQICTAAVNCRYDGGALANYAFTKADISTRDYFHPSLAGQTTIATLTWPKTQWVS